MAEQVISKPSCSKSTDALFDAILFREGEVIIQTLLQQGADIEATDSKGLTPLLLACSIRDKLIVYLLIKTGANVNVCDRNKNTVLHYASLRENWENILLYLVKIVPDLDARNICGETPMHLASSAGNLRGVKCLLEAGANIVAKNLADITPLLCAAQSQRVHVYDFLKSKATVDGNERLLLYFASLNGWMVSVRSFVERLPDLKKTYVIGETDLNAASSIGHLELVKCLLEEGNELNTRMIIEAALQEASLKGHVELVEWIVIKGADMKSELNLNAKLLCHTALHRASGHGHLEVVKCLVEKGADINSRNCIGQTPLRHAYENLEVVKYLLEKGAEINTRDDSGTTALHLASGCGHLETVKYLLENGADVNAISCRGVSPLLFAAERSRRDALDLLMRFGANVNVSNREKFTTLHFASANGWLETVQYLVKRVCDLDARQRYGLTALEIACRKQKWDIVKCLLKAGASWDITDIYGNSPLDYFTWKITPDFKFIQLFIESGAYLNRANCDAIVKSSSLKVLQDVKLCCQAVINKFNNHDLPELYELPASRILPRIEKMKIAGGSEVAQAIEQTVGFEIVTKGHCNILDIRPKALKIYSVGAVLENDKKRNRN